jgi:hypothetical protein
MSHFKIGQSQAQKQVVVKGGERLPTEASLVDVAAAGISDRHGFEKFFDTFLAAAPDLETADAGGPEPRGI